MTVKLPWEIPTIYSEILKQSGHRSDDEEDEDEMEAHEDSIQRLRVGLQVRIDEMDIDSQSRKPTKRRVA